MHPVEQAAAMQSAQLGAEQRLRRGRYEQHMAVAADPGDDVGHVAGEQPLAALYGVIGPVARVRPGLRPEREAHCVEQRRDDAQHRRQGRLGRGRKRRGLRIERAHEQEKSSRAERHDRNQRDDLPGARKRGLHRHQDEPDRRE